MLVDLHIEIPAKPQPDPSTQASRIYTPAKLPACARQPTDVPPTIGIGMNRFAERVDTGAFLHQYAHVCSAIQSVQTTVEPATIASGRDLIAGDFGTAPITDRVWFLLFVCIHAPSGTNKL